MENKNNLALGPILEANDANSNEQETKKASGKTIDQTTNKVLALMFGVVDSIRDELSRMYHEQRPSSQQTNPRGAGRKSFDICFMFKLLVIQSFFDLSDYQLLKTIKNRLDLLELLGVTPGFNFPCATTVWGYREMFVKSDLHDIFGLVAIKLLNTCQTYMAEHGISTI